MSAPRNLKAITGQVAIRAEEAAGPRPEVGNNYNLCLIISRACFDPSFPLSHVVRCTQIRVSVAATDFHSAELVDQKEIDYARDRVGAIHCGRFYAITGVVNFFLVQSSAEWK